MGMLASNSETLSTILQWFCGGADHHYHRLYSCMGHDTLWVALTIVLDLAVAIGYAMIAYHWWRNQRNFPNTPARQAHNVPAASTTTKPRATRPPPRGLRAPAASRTSASWPR